VESRLAATTPDAGARLPGYDEFGQYRMTDEDRAALWPVKPPRPQTAGRPGSDELFSQLDELRALHVEKTAAYGSDRSAFENVEASERCGVEPWRRALCDLSDCVVRMQGYAKGNATVDWENALADAAMWALIARIMLRREASGAR